MTDKITRVHIDLPNVYVLASLFQDVGSVEKLHQFIGQQIESSIFSIFIDPHMLLSVEHLQHSLHKAIFNKQNGRMRSKYIASEIFYFLTQSKQIQECIEHYGINGESKDVLLVSISLSCNDAADVAKLKEHLQSVCDLVECGKQVDLFQVIGKDGYVNKNKIISINQIMESELSLPNGLETALFSRIAIKDV